jgi:hypothetical protein
MVVRPRASDNPIVEAIMPKIRKQVRYNRPGLCMMM